MNNVYPMLQHFKDFTVTVYSAFPLMGYLVLILQKVDTM